MAVEFVPTTKAAPRNPSAWASAPSPMAREPLNNVLVQSGPLPIPKIDAQVAFAAGATLIRRLRIIRWSRRQRRGRQRSCGVSSRC